MAAQRVRFSRLPIFQFSCIIDLGRHSIPTADIGGVSGHRHPPDGPARDILPSASLTGLLAAIPRAVPSPSPNQERSLRQIDVLGQRLAADCFQVAVLGQFKRGKSTLLNALLGTPLLPIGVVPVTAIPTFLQAGPTLGLRVINGSGEMRELPVDGPGAFREQLQALVTESGNPKNVRDIARVEVKIPAALLREGVVLIDTPGVGSTFQHNTMTADALLPECDACLFVVSADPPITEVEIDYLLRIKQHVARIIIVLNKFDAIEEPDRPAAVAFLRSVLAEQAGLSDPIFCVSARAAVRAQAAVDGQALESSGLTALEGYLGNVLTHEKRQVLQQAVARKADALVGDVVLEMELVLQSLRLPASDLEQRLAVFGKAEKQFDGSRRATHDLLAGDRARTVQRLEAIARQLHTDAVAAMRIELDRVLAGGGDAEQARLALAALAQGFFDASLSRFVDEVRSYIAEALSAHQGRADDLIGLVRRTAAELLDIPYRAPAAGEAFVDHHQPYWTASGRTETVIPFNSGALDRFLPKSIRRTRLAGRLMAEAEVLVTRNVEKLRWATLRNLDDAFRRFGAELDERMAMALAATKGAMEAALERRGQVAGRIGPEIKDRLDALRKLNDIQMALTEIHCSQRP